MQTAKEIAVKFSRTGPPPRAKRHYGVIEMWRFPDGAVVTAETSLHIGIAFWCEKCRSVSCIHIGLAALDYFYQEDLEVLAEISNNKEGQ